MRLFVILTLLLLASCAARGPSFDEDRANVTATPNDQARIVFFRTRDSKLYIARKATVSIDGIKVGSTAYGGYHHHDVAPGVHVLRADMWDAPGQCELTLIANEQQTYFFQVDPRLESFGAFSVAGFTAGLVSGGVIADIAGGLAGATAESYGKECGGAFRLYPVDQQTALLRLEKLKLSE
ncbi:MAG: hypothetical protein HKN77_06160 [Woeseiaceae bacterium]|nr:hypothetical protein [Woeseiaceae bacterium]